MECLQIDSNGQGYIIQTKGNHFPVPNLFFTRVAGWDEGINWKLNRPIHRRVIRITPIVGVLRKTNIPRTTPVYDPSTDPTMARCKLCHSQTMGQAMFIVMMIEMKKPARTLDAETKVDEEEERLTMRTSTTMSPIALTPFKKVLLPFNILIPLCNRIGIKDGRHRTKGSMSMLMQVINNELK